MSREKKEVKPYGAPRFCENYIGVVPVYFALLVVLLGCGIGIKKLLIAHGWIG